MTSAPVYTCPEHVRWVKDTSQVLIVDEARAQTFVLQGAEAVLWGWLSLRYSYPRLVALMASLLGLPAAQAAATLRQTLQHWHAAGLLETAEATTHG